VDGKFLAVGDRRLWVRGVTYGTFAPDEDGIRFGSHEQVRRDFAAMAEVVSRRFARLAAGAAADDYDRSFAATPNLVVIDGGKGQLSAALAAMQAYDLPRVAVIALAKRIEEVYVPGRPDPIVLSRHNPGLQLLQRIRDEAHRFAVTYHQNVRAKRAVRSVLDDVDGVGPAKKRALLRRFGSVRGMREAPVSDLASVTGVGAALAERIKQAIES